MKQATLRSRLILGFGIVTIPLVILVLWNNLYATKVVHSQVAQSNQNLLTVYMNDIDQVLEEIENYLYKTAEQDQSLISLGQYNKDSWEYYLSKTQTVNDLFLNTTYYTAADVLFAYSARHDDLFIAQQQSVSYEEKQSIQDKLREILTADPGQSAYSTRWNIVEQNGEFALVRIVGTDYRSFIGAWIDLGRLMQPLQVLNEDGKGKAFLVSKEGAPLTKLEAPIMNELNKIGLESYLAEGMASYNIVELTEPFLLVANPSRFADMDLILLVPERSLLERLPYFQMLTYWVPVIAFIMLILYLIFLQRSIVTPIHALIKGMRKIRSGDLTVRMDDNRLLEFNSIKETFNGMAEQIEHLKIDIYEEHIRTQKAELKHLQAQIHPHFFMNSLNIVYHLAQIRNYDIIQKLALHLVRYFRYTTRTQVSTITIKEEMEHIYHYLSIQKYRFPNNLEYEFEVDPELEACEIPPLIVQPLVENAMVHGFTMSQGLPFQIKVRVFAAEDGPDSDLFIEAIDNGRGFAEGKLAELTEQVHAEEPGEGGHIGLWNVANRCRLYYKTGVKMQFADTEPKGATVQIRLPRQKAIRRWGI
ncbi:hypothetical protein SD71_07650 [Cohnella kolymensis]|uniref:HAMP domain-containing protein n=1 Tax=Cohnella kolymensis TaxID=1590652 RepID=A0ABR5A675_9BACL|nr:histidine kinase [Cohnella kolymensis]KIL36470.1 hypothetical protein SD71_07650 [Cohnella kolymensis]